GGPRVSKASDALGRACLGHETERDPAADRIFVREIPAGHRLIDDDHRRTGRGILCVEVAPTYDLDFHRIEEIRTNGEIARRLSPIIRRSTGTRVGWWNRLAFDQKLHR